MNTKGTQRRNCYRRKYSRKLLIAPAKKPPFLSSDVFSRHARPPPCTLLEVNPALFVPHAARSCCRLFYKSIARLTSLVFYQFLCRMSLCRVPGLQRKTRYSIHGITGGWSSKRYQRGKISNTALRDNTIFLLYCKTQTSK